MKRSTGLLLFVIVLLWSCGRTGERNGARLAEKVVMQQEDGTFSLRLTDAGCYKDVADPSNNTAEWTVAISRAGGYKVWLASATRDTINLNYLHTVKVNLADSQLVVIPICDKIIRNSSDVAFPYFRADTYMGSFYVSEPGEYNVQVISEKVVPESESGLPGAVSENSRMLAIILSPNDRAHAGH